MGIKNLNKFIRNNCSDSIKFISMKELSEKKIAIDISIYMYKFAAENTLIENIYLMLSIFRYYNIIPIFIFDGKPPTEKKALLEKRKKDKKEAQKEYEKLSDQLKYDNIDEYDKQELITNMDLLKKQFIYINKEKIDSVKNLIRAYGGTYYDAPEEADELCASLVIKNKVWACLSEDMDMFVYGCPRVLRYFSLLNHTIVMYNLDEILNNLGLNQKELREICVLSGTDYNYNMNTINNVKSVNNVNNVNNINENKIKKEEEPNLYKTLKYFKKYNKSDQYNKIDFYEWLNANTNYIKNYNILNKIYKMFDISETQIHNKILIFDKIKIINGPIIYNDIKKILIEDGFIFPNKRK